MSSAGLTPAVSYIQGYGENGWGFYSPVKALPSERKFVYVGRSCLGLTSSGYGLFELPWDNAAPGWSLAIPETTYTPPVGLIGVDGPASRVYSAFTPRYANDPAACKDLVLSATRFHTFEWP